MYDLLNFPCFSVCVKILPHWPASISKYVRMAHDDNAIYLRFVMILYSALGSCVVAANTIPSPGKMGTDCLFSSSILLHEMRILSASFLIHVCFLRFIINVNDYLREWSNNKRPKRLSPSFPMHIHWSDKWRNNHRPLAQFGVDFEVHHQSVTSSYTKYVGGI